MTIEPEIRKQGNIYFLTEAPELLHTIKREILSLSDGYNTSKMYNLLRATHTLKGSASNLGLEVIQEVAHTLESIFNLLYHHSEIVVDSNLRELLLQAHKCLHLILVLEITNSNINYDKYIQKTRLILGQLPNKLTGYTKNNFSRFPSLKLDFDSVKFIWETCVGQCLERIYQAIKTEKDIAEFRDFLRSQAEILMAVGKSCDFPGFSAIARTTIVALEANPSQVLEIAEIALADFERGRQAILADDTPCEPYRDRTRGGQPSLALQEFTKRVTSDTYPRGEMLETPQHSSRSPLANILNGFPQMVEKLGKTYGKVVKLKLTGTEVLVDPGIAQKLYDPLLQLILNALAHGIELPQVRLNQGKPSTGLIEICAYNQEKLLIIEVRDDGQGLDLKTIRYQAGKMNLIPESYLNEQSLNEQSLLEVLFAPGFSTATTVSHICGRGMGLDIVRSELLALNGSVTVQSIPQKGTTFLLKVPENQPCTILR
ncbi:MAG: ATP-binding protein [Nostocaceae cyanobacterium]|nr:ATP-binding protein [Nostocaceae cyanobacterium]